MGYVLVPIALLRAFAHDPLAIGCYIAIARAALLTRGKAMVSSADLARLVGDSRSAMRTQIARRIEHLAQTGWLAVTATAGGKRTLLPSWGRGRDGTPIGWTWEKPHLGRPRTVARIAVPHLVLDEAIGCLNPMPGRIPSVITRLFTHPLLTLHDVGTVALRLAGIMTTSSPAVEHILGLDPDLTAPSTLLRLLAEGERGTLHGWCDGTCVPTTLTPFGRQRYATCRSGSDSECRSGSDSECRSGSDSECRSGSDSGSDSSDSAAACALLPPITRLQSPSDECMGSWDDHDQIPPLPPTSDDITRGGESVAWRVLPQTIPIPEDTPSLDDQYCAVPGQTDQAPWPIPSSPGETPAYLHDTTPHTAFPAWLDRPPVLPAPVDQASASTATPHRGADSVSPPASRPALDPAHIARCAAMGIVTPSAIRALASADTALLDAWEQVLTDPTLRAGLLASGTHDPVGFAVARLKAGAPPPDPATLRRWLVGTAPAADVSGIRNVSTIPVEEWAEMSPDERNAVIAAQSYRVNWRAAGR